MSEPLNLIKQVCKDQSLTYAQLGERIGYGEGAIRNAVSGDKISAAMQKAIELYLQTIALEAKLSDFDTITTLLGKHIKH